jgi:hypothetical protein
MPRKTDIGNADAMPSVKLYVASTGWPYKPRWSPQSPLILFTGGAEEDPGYLGKKGHICNRFKDLISAVAQPEHDDIFVVDISQIASKSEWREEIEKPAKFTRMLSKWLIKLNPSASTVVAHGMDVKLVEGMVRGWTTPCTSPVERPVEKVIVVGKSVNKKILESISEIAKVNVVNPSVQAIKANIVQAKRKELKQDCNFGAQLSDFHFISVEFSFDPNEKTTVQTPIDITPMVACSGTARLTMPTRESVENDVQNSERIATHHLDFGMTVSHLIVQVLCVTDADAMLNIVVADTHGSIEALARKTMSEELQQGSIVSVSGRVLSVQGRRSLLIEDCKVEDSLHREGYASVRIGERNASHNTHLSGCLIVRGAKCLLVHQSNTVHMPFTEPRIAESKVQAATRAVKHACKIHAEEFALLSDLPPAVAYDKGGDHSVVYTAFLAVATAPAPSVSCCGGNQKCEDGLYDWYTFEEAISVLKSAAEKKCFLSLAWAFAEAIDAGVFVVDSPCAFRPKLAAIDDDWKVDVAFNPLLTLGEGKPRSSSSASTASTASGASSPYASSVASGDLRPCQPCRPSSDNPTAFCPKVVKKAKENAMNWKNGITGKCGKAGGCPPGCC